MMRLKTFAQLLTAVTGGLLLAIAALRPPADAAPPAPLIQTLVASVSEAEITDTIRIPFSTALRRQYSHPLKIPYPKIDSIRKRC